ncbi:MAG: hypothetical protein MUO82_02795 [Candidatus Thermoplasmatota archaeon]|nr:hypothetical protein [Candidatus Thermoplasmatota archaeon]
MSDNGKITQELANLFDSFYKRFVLLDLFGKITPGAIFLLTVAITVFNPKEFSVFVNYLKEIFIWIIFISISWLIGFAIQGFGEQLKFIRYYPKAVDFKKDFNWVKEIKKLFPELENEEDILEMDDKKWHKIYILFRNIATPSQQENVSRLVVIKEACGNGYLAIAFSYLLLLGNIVYPNDSIFSNFVKDNGNFFIMLSILIIVFVIFLYLMHRSQRNKQWSYMSTSLEYCLKNPNK